MAAMTASRGRQPKGSIEIERVAPAELHGEDPGNLDMSLWDIFLSTASRYPDRDAIISMWQQPWREQPVHHSHKLHEVGNLRWTYHDLITKSSTAAATLERLGCRRGMCLGVVLWNSAEWGLFFWIAAQLGMKFASVDPRDPREVLEILGCLTPDVVVVQDAKGAAILGGAEKPDPMPFIHIQCSGILADGWTALPQIFSAAETPSLSLNHVFDDSAHRDNNAVNEDIALIIFTSGTTGKPKGCPHTNSNIISQTCDYDPNIDAAFVDRWLVHTPVSHIFAVNNALRAWRYGGAVIFPSQKFDVESTAQALVKEKCTIMSATPTVVKALLAHPMCPSYEDMSLSLVSMAAAKITAEDIRLCREELRARDAIQAYGMSEGAPLISWSRRDGLLKDRLNPGIGKVLPGAKIRVCHPETHEVLALRQVGELHVSGSSIISGYLGQVGSSAFYDDEVGRWFATGDQVVIDDHGVVQFLGRYKELIVRGGEKLNPIKIEEALEDIKGVQAWVVGAEDNFAGEVPVAIVQLPGGISKTQLYEQAAKLGSRYVLGGIYTLGELQLETFPKTSIGKIKKEKLKAAVRRLRTQQLSNPGIVSAPISSDSVSEDLVTRLLDIWEELTGSRPYPDTTMDHIADSITLLRYCDAVFRSCGKRLYLQDVVEQDTIGRQAQLLKTRNDGRRSLEELPVTTTQSTEAHHPPSPPPDYTVSSARIGVTFSHPSSLWSQKLRISSREEMLRKEAHMAVKNAGLGSSSVEAVIPIRESFYRMVTGQRPQSYHVRMVFRVHHASIHQIRRGVERGLVCRPMLRSMLFKPAQGGAHHAVLGASNDMLENLVMVRYVKCEEEAKRRWEDESHTTQSCPLMFQAEILSVQNNGNKYLSMLFNHSVVDALSLWPWHMDLDLLINDINAKTWEATSFKLFADLFDQYRNSVPAQEAVSVHVRRLRGISRLKQALWPVQRAPGWMISSDRDSKYSEARDQVRKEVWNGEWEIKGPAFHYPRLGRVVCLPQLEKLKGCGIEPSLFMKSAIVAFNVVQTGASHAVFNTWESGRSWPFVPRWIEGMLPPAMSIDGPTVEWILNMIEVVKGEKISDFFQRMKIESEELKNYEHVPWQKVVKELRDEGDVAIDASFRQSFVWDVSLGLGVLKGNRGVFKCLEPVARLDWADCGLFWNAFMIDWDNLYFVASWDTAQMNDVEVDGCCDLLADVMRKLGDERNWEKTFGHVFRT